MFSSRPSKNSGGSIDEDALSGGCRCDPSSGARVEAEDGELNGRESTSILEQHTNVVITNLVKRAEERCLEQEGPLPSAEFEEIRGELREGGF
jgi:hypothetical protein